MEKKLCKCLQKFVTDSRTQYFCQKKKFSSKDLSVTKYVMLMANNGRTIYLEEKNH